MSKPHPSRRQPGSGGKKVRVVTNAFELKWSGRSNGSGFVYHYDTMTPQWDTRREDFKIGAQKGTELVMRLQEQVQPQKFSPLGAYDGKKNLYSSDKYSFTSEEFTVPWQNRPSNKDVSVKVVFVRAINYGSLQRLLAGDSSALNPEGDAVISMNMLNIFVQASPKMKEPRIHNVKSFFTPVQSRQSQVRPLELWRGFFQSVRPTFDRVIVNVDVTVGVIVPAKKLEVICGEYASVHNARDLSNLRQSGFQQLRLFVRGLKVIVEIPGRRGNRPKAIKDLVQDVGAKIFDKGGVPTSVADHFLATHNIRIPPKSLGVVLGQDGQFPISVCSTIQQLFKNRASPEIVRDALAFSPATPRERMAIIADGWQQLQYNQSSFLVGAGISVTPVPIEVQGRILPNPEISFGNRNTISPQRPGVWDVMGKILFSPAMLERWAVVDLALADPNLLEPFIQDLAKTMRERGMTVKNAPHLIQGNPSRDIAQTLYRAAQEANAQILVVILQESASHPYREVKRFGDVTQGIPTQCVRWSSKLIRDAKGRKCNQYHNNLILKINAKLGGINYFPSSKAMTSFTNERTMVLGADVSHPAPRSLLPSVAALVASMDSRASRYVASIRVQQSRVEMIEDISNMFDSALETFRNINGGHLPRRIVFFRDGVSEGEFATVREKELNAMKAPLQKHYGDTKLWPKLVFIIVGKRHHFRFFPGQSGAGADARGNGNLLPGFVADQDIVHPVYGDFYLQSQPGLKGTSRPSHYTVLVNGAGMSIDELQQLAYDLCHSYSRSTRSVKIPAPVYYADLVCRRAKFHFDDDVHDIDSDNGSIHSGEGPHIDFYKQRFQAINERMKSTMYFV